MKILLATIVSIGATLVVGFAVPVKAVGYGDRLSPATSVLAQQSINLFERGNRKQDQENYLGAIADYTEFIKNNPRHSASYRQRGFAKAMINDLRGALNDLNASLALEPNHADTYNARGNVRALVGSLKSSIQDFDRAIRIDRNFADAYYNRGISRHGLKDFRGAKADLRTASKLFRQQRDLGGYQQAVNWIEKLP
jgi:tetratricopeptide (TPR) repeat protein